MKWSSRPVIMIGNGCRDADLTPLLSLGVPILSSWQAADLIDNNHPMYFGRPGVYGQRCANRILTECDMVLAIGNRLSLFNIGHAGFRDNQRLVMVDIDEDEVARFPKAEWVSKDAAAFITSLAYLPILDWEQIAVWKMMCNMWRTQWPWFDLSHVSKNGYINSYEFIHRLQPYLRPDEVIVTDMGVALTGAHQVLKLRPPQRLMTSGGLGEMGVALPAAIGASFARDKGQVLCLHCDGGMMMNLQELQTIVHHKLPIKIVVFCNDGYNMIKSTQKNLGYDYTGVNSATGVSLPNYSRLAYAFGIQAGHVKTWEDFARVMSQFFETEEPSLLEVFIDPEQRFTPKLEPIMVDGKPMPPAFNQLSPILEDEARSWQNAME